MSKKTHRISLYDSKKNFETGKGQTSRSFQYENEQEKEDKIKQIKELQKQKNKEFTINLKLRASDSNLIITNREHKIPKPKILGNIKLLLDRGTGNTTVIFGSSKSGKSTLMMYLYKKYYDRKNIISTLFSPSAHIKLFKKEKALIKSFDFGMDGEHYVKTQRYINQKTRNKYQFLNMFDDIIDVRFNRIINDLILTYRNSRISTIINIQYVKLLSMSARSNVNNIIFMHLNTHQDIKNTIEALLQSTLQKIGLKTVNDMINFYRKMTKDHGFMYFNPSSEQLTFHKLKIQNPNSLQKKTRKTKKKN